MHDYEPEALDLELQRTIDAPVSAIWQAWTDAELLEKWWAPAPVVVRVVELDLRPGGAFRTVMTLPDGTEMPTAGIFIQVEPGERVVFTDAVAADWRPASSPFFTAVITMEDRGEKTLYSVRALHGNPEDRRRHAEMGFEASWGMALAQLEAIASKL